MEIIDMDITIYGYAKQIKQIYDNFKSDFKKLFGENEKLPNNEYETMNQKLLEILVNQGIVEMFVFFRAKINNIDERKEKDKINKNTLTKIERKLYEFVFELMINDDGPENFEDKIEEIQEFISEVTKNIYLKDNLKKLLIYLRYMLK
ncbi:hypothetical protein SAMN02745164_02111 [Marinitoga hydrogenitolerans DSM 16785]|uniref:Uncharacterized protein n=1 Tax=Marinitoga hydrogenitolerans (strain DSM 16785 / JCM 12826 / AT1271) TaxID=1122195 RepID=A0A1M5A6U0_MARH1|nr:hypothetical protein [Marinitoga hydrogenitolerans]SHF25756.1 hypothetical protein SAMN02745164_02111 [Marinitoga hydrogenitolerans DSM 16785]